MKHKKVATVFAAVSLIASLVLVPTGLASASTISLAPNASSVSKGSIVSVGIYINTGGEPVNAAKATLSYPANLLDFVSISNSAAFNIVAANSGGGGTVQVDRGAFPAVSGRQLVASVSFRAKTDAGAAAISIVGGSALSANTNGETYTGGSGTSLTLKEVPPPPAPPPPPDTTAPTISDIKVTALGPNTATITWKTSEPANSKVDYGFNTSYGITAADNALVTEHKITLNPNLLKPLTEVHFIVNSADAAGNNAASKDMSLTTKGLTVKLTLLDQHKKPLKNALVDLGDKPARTNAKGQVTVVNLPAGKNRGVVTYDGQVIPITVTVNEAIKDALVSVQSATVGIKVKQTSSVWPAVLIVMFLLLVASGISAGPYLHKRLQKKHSGGPPEPPAASGGAAPSSKSGVDQKSGRAPHASATIMHDSKHLTLAEMETKYAKRGAGATVLPSGLPRRHHA